MNRYRTYGGPFLVVVALATTLWGCGGGDDTATPGASSTTQATSSVPYSPADSKDDDTAQKATPIDVTYNGGTITGGGRKEVKLGDTVAIQVTSDVADEVHLHGYDKKVDAEPGTPALLEFTADIPGVFEVELESKGIPLLELVVR